MNAIFQAHGLCLRKQRLQVGKDDSGQRSLGTVESRVSVSSANFKFYEIIRECIVHYRSLSLQREQ